MTLDDLTVKLDHLNSNKLLEEWVWLLGESKFPILLLASGDAFIQDKETGFVYFLDTGSGLVEEVSKNPKDFRERLTDEDFVVDYFAMNFVVTLIENKLTLKKGQVYSTKIPLVLGGEVTLENINAMDIEVHFSILGQIHHQLKNLPIGTEISKVDIVKGRVNLSS